MVGSNWYFKNGTAKFDFFPQEKLSLWIITLSDHFKQLANWVEGKIIHIT